VGAPIAVERVEELPALPARPRDGHKGTFGKVLILAGSRGMSGAACLAGVAALRGGAGLVTLASPACVIPIIAGYEPSYLTCPLEEDQNGRVSLAAAPRIMEILSQQTAGAVGPGLGLSADIEELVYLIYRTCELPLVIDADGLNALAARNSALGRADSAGPRVLTPHPGEFSRLTGTSIEQIGVQRIDHAVNFAAAHDVLLLLKGPGTLITDGRRLAINTTGNSGMATGGSGDVLTGLITALLGQGLEPFAAAQLGAHLHGLAGDLAAADLSEPGLISSDLLSFLGRAWQRLQSSTSTARILSTSCVTEPA